MTSDSCDENFLTGNKVKGTIQVFIQLRTRQYRSRQRRDDSGELVGMGWHDNLLSKHPYQKYK
jgi:hypothetical protein